MLHGWPLHGETATPYKNQYQNQFDKSGKWLQLKSGFNSLVIYHPDAITRDNRMLNHRRAVNGRI